MNERDIIKRRQSKVTKEGEAKEIEVKNLLLEDSFIKSSFAIDKPSKVLKEKSPLYIPYESDKTMIDADLCIVRKEDNKLVCVISIKKSFRERGGLTAYWAKKVKEHSKDYKYILVTPDVDNELFDLNKPEKKVANNTAL